MKRAAEAERGGGLALSASQHSFAGEAASRMGMATEAYGHYNTAADYAEQLLKNPSDAREREDYGLDAAYCRLNAGRNAFTAGHMTDDPGEKDEWWMRGVGQLCDCKAHINQLKSQGVPVDRIRSRFTGSLERIRDPVVEEMLADGRRKLTH